MKNQTPYMMHKKTVWPLFAVALLVALAGPARGQKSEVPKPEPPQIDELKDLHLTTPLVEDGQPQVAIVTPDAYEDEAEQIQDVISDIAGATVPIVDADAPQAAVPLTTNLIALGNRSTNPAISTLYDRYYTLLDLKYPGPGGHVVRSLHDPFGNGYNVIFAGGSDAGGVADAADMLAGKLRRAGGRDGALSVGRLMAIELSDSFEIPDKIGRVPQWGQARGFSLRSNFGQDSTNKHFRGNFGWNTISKEMALYYMTGEKQYAREVVRLAFPDKATQKELFALDNRAYGNLEDPLSAPMHYYAHLSIFYWDLIEESPAFSDDEKLRITRSLNRQIKRRAHDHNSYQLTEVPEVVGGRHPQYAALSLWCLARYFHKYYPDPVWTQAWQGSNYFFQAFYDNESENMYWYSSSIAPAVKYMVLSGDRTAMRNGNMPQLLRAHEQIISGQKPGFALWFTALNQLNRIAHLTGDGRWLYYRKRLGLDTDIFRLGQSFWPSDDLTPHPPTDLVGRWSINPMQKVLWKRLDTGYPLEESFLWGSFRSTPTDAGDYVLFDGFDGEARNAMHKLALVQMRIDGETILQGKSRGRKAILQGHLNQVMTKAAGMVEPHFPKSAALRYRNVLGGTATFTGAVPEMTYADWQRTLAQRIGRYALLVDKLTFQAKKKKMEVQTLWQGALAAWDGGDRVLNLTEKNADGELTSSGQVRTADVMPVDMLDDVARMSWVGAVEPGDQRTAFSLVTPGEHDDRACLRVADQAAVLRVPEPALAVAGSYQRTEGKVVVMERNHLFGRAMTRAEPGEMLLAADSPVNADWDFETGRLVLQSEGPAQVRFHAAAEAGASAQMRRVTVEGEKTIEGVYPGRGATEALREMLQRQLDRGRKRRKRALRRKRTAAAPLGKAMQAAWTTTAPGQPDRLVLPDRDVRESQEAAYHIINDRDVLQTAGRVDGAQRLFVAQGHTISQLNAQGNVLRTMETDAPVQALHWWPEAAESVGRPLLLAGLRNETVVAFTPSGERAWTFQSEMAPRLVKTGQTQWFKSALPGIYGIDSGPFMDGKEQAFVGSATTMEILNPDGTLATRQPAFWGPPVVFKSIKSGSHRKLLVGRNPTGKMRLAIFDSETLNRTSGFDEVPQGQTYINPWGQMSRRHIFYKDMDDDGTREVISELNGTWNRVSVWDTSGAPRYNANFGPGRPIPYPNVRDVDVADLEGDGPKEVLVGTDDGWLLALDHRLGKVWAKRLPSRPMVFTTVESPGGGRRAVVGSKDGTVRVFGPGGRVLKHGVVEGTPEQISVLQKDGRPMAVIATESGRIAGFEMR